MRVVILSQWYQPEPEPRAHALARGLVARGHAVTAITGLPNYPAGRIYPGYALRPWPQVEVRDGVRVIRVPIFPERSRSVAKRLVNYLSFALSAAFFGPIMSGPADVVWVYHPPLSVALPAVAVAAVRRAPFVYEVQDLWPETLAATGMVKSSRILRAVEGVARLVYRRASRICVISPGFRRNLISKGVPARSIEVIPNWADEETFRPRIPSMELARELGCQTGLTILYAGNMGPAQALHNVLDAAELLMDLPLVRFLMVGDGIEAESLEQSAKARKLDNVRFLGRVSPERVAELAAVASVQLVHLKDDPLFEITIPSKTISAMACGRPILTVAAGDPADVVLSAGAGVSCPPGDPVALALAVRTLYNLPPDQLRQMGERGRAYFLANFAQERLLDRYESVLVEVAAHNRSQEAGR